MKKPNIFYQATLGSILKIFTLFKRQKFIQKTKIKGPAIVLSNHTSFYDFMYTFSAVYPRRINFVAARKMFHEDGLKTFMKISRSIPKSLMESDSESVKNILKVLKNNGIIGLFPEGQISPSGETMAFNKAISKLIKKSKVNVYIVKHFGAGLKNPGWSKKTFKGKIYSKSYLLFKPSDLEILTLDEIYDQIYENLYLSNESLHEEFNLKYQVNKIDNLNNLIYLCDNCHYEGLVIKDNKMVCPSCNKEFIYNNKGFINNIPFNKVFKYQQEYVEKEIKENDSFNITAKCNLFSIKDKKMGLVGNGIISLNKDEYTYIGLINNTQTKLVFDPINVPYLPSDIGRNIQIYDKNQVYQFELENKWLPTKFVHAADNIHKEKMRV